MVRLNTAVTKVVHEEEGKWRLEIQGSQPEIFDRVVIANGINQIPNIPAVTGIELFEGECLHSRAFKR
jgi:dimethylaniline monooxygenase (N-oxide forming)